MAIIGIDLGTTNSLAAVWRNGRSELIPNAAGEFLTPSAVSVDEDGSVLVGRAARDRLISHPERTAARFKRFMGTEKTFRLGGRTFTPEELSSLVLRSLREDAEAYLGEVVEEAVVSVPAYFAEAQRSAAVAGRIGQGEADKVCLVFDLGGGTLDVSLVERFGNVVSVTAVSGDNRLGGSDFDLAIARGFCEDCGLDFDGLTPRQKELLIRQGETCKMALTRQEMVIMSVDDGSISAALTLSNEWLIRKCGALFRRMTAPIQRVFLDGGVSLQELDDLVMVGGSSHMPAVRRYIARALHKEPVRDSRPDTAIALGAGVCAGMKARAGDLKELVLTDVCPFTLGVARYNESERDRDLMSPIIERNSVLPTSKMGVYYTVRDGQDKVDVRIYQGENRYCADNALLGELQVPVPPAPRGRQSVRIRFTYDINGLLEVEVVNEAGQAERLVLQNKDMTAQEAERRLKELSRLKLHPREQEEYRAMAARGERLYAVTVGSLREQVGDLLDWYQRVLSTQEALKIAKATKRLDRFFDQAEAYLGDAALSPPEPFDEPFDGDEEEDL